VCVCVCVCMLIVEYAFELTTHCVWLHRYISARVRENVLGPTGPSTIWSAVCLCGNGNFLYNGKNGAHGPGRTNAAHRPGTEPNRTCTARTKKEHCPWYGVAGGHEGCSHVFYTRGAKLCEITSAGVGVQPCHCEAVADEIAKLHRGSKPMWSQSDPRKWLQDGGHWELAKIYSSVLDGRPIDPDTNCLTEYCANKRLASDFAGDNLLNMGKMCAAFRGKCSQTASHVPIYSDDAGNAVSIDVDRWDVASHARNHVSESEI
jgi:hypothetical protein